MIFLSVLIIEYISGPLYDGQHTKFNVFYNIYFMVFKSCIKNFDDISKRKIPTILLYKSYTS